MPSKLNIPPHPKNFIESMRRYGYDHSTSVADLVDNSISAQAKNIWIDCYPSPEDLWLSITDDGKGMTNRELITAMTLGAKDPNKERKTGDLGRFGLGLKTASFSQCRQLTVISRRGKNPISAAKWDLDLIEKDNAWSLLEFNKKDLSKLPKDLRSLEADGTQVLWQNLDSIEGDTKEEKASDLNEKIALIKDDLSLIFHRFLNLLNKSLKDKINIYINDQQLSPIDPFLTSNAATQLLNAEKIKNKDGSTVELKAYILPHHNKLNSDEKKIIEGRKGLTGGQGFYFYREKRLISYGGWQGMQRLKELSKLARVQVDIPNSLDKEWITRVNKSGMSPPMKVRKVMQRLIDKISGRSIKVYKQRGKKKIVQKNLLWKKLVEEGFISYEIDYDNVAIKDFMKKTSKSSQKELLKILKKISKDLPLESIYHDYADSPEKTEAGQSNIDDEIENLLKGLLKNEK